MAQIQQRPLFGQMDPPAQKLLQELELRPRFSGRQACVCHLCLGFAAVNVWVCLGDVTGAPGRAELQGWQPSTVLCDMMTRDKGTFKDCFHIVTALLKGPEQHLEGFHFAGSLFMVVTS